jgi:protein-tyrosine phosphatase
MPKPIKVLFVCMGNICRSPTAEGVFSKLHKELAPELDIQVDSAGTHAYHIGDPPDPRSYAAALERNVDIGSHRGRQATFQDFHDFDYVIAMDSDNLRRLQALRPKDSRGQLRLLLEYAPKAGLLDVPDPYYGGAGGFERVLDLVEQGSRGLLEEIKKRAKP